MKGWDYNSFTFLNPERTFETYYCNFFGIAISFWTQTKYYFLLFLIFKYFSTSISGSCLLVRLKGTVYDSFAVSINEIVPKK